MQGTRERSGPLPKIRVFFFPGEALNENFGLADQI